MKFASQAMSHWPEITEINGVRDSIVQLNAKLDVEARKIDAMIHLKRRSELKSSNTLRQINFNSFPSTAFGRVRACRSCSSSLPSLL